MTGNPCTAQPRPLTSHTLPLRSPHDPLTRGACVHLCYFVLHNEGVAQGRRKKPGGATKDRKRDTPKDQKVNNGLPLTPPTPPTHGRRVKNQSSVLNTQGTVFKEITLQLSKSQTDKGKLSMQHIGAMSGKLHNVRACKQLAPSYRGGGFPLFVNGSKSLTNTVLKSDVDSSRT